MDTTRRISGILGRLLFALLHGCLRNRLDLVGTYTLYSTFFVPLARLLLHRYVLVSTSSVLLLVPRL